MIFHYEDTPIYYNKFGSGPVWVLLHGFLESSSMWKPLMAQFSDSRTFITIDLPGHGSSGVIDKVHSMECMADVVHTLLEHLKISDVTILGHSMGGYVSLAFAEKYAEKVNTLVLLNSTAAADSEVRKLNRDRAITALDENAELFLGLAISNLFSAENRVRYSEEIKKLKTEALQFPLAGIKAAILGMKEREDRSSVLEKLQSKKVVIAGKKDTLLPVLDLNRLAINSKASFFEVPGGHMSHIEAFNEIVKIVHFIE